MALSATDIVNGIYADMSTLFSTGESNPSTALTDAQSIVANNIGKYIISKLKLNGTYPSATSASISGSGPDPAAGSYVWSVSDCPLKGDVLATEMSNLTKTDNMDYLNLWFEAVAKYIRQTTFEASDDSKIVTLKTSPFLSNLAISKTVDDMNKSIDYKSSILTIVTWIVDAIVALAPSPSSTSISSKTGKGTANLVSFI